jgi:putative lipoprotein
MGNIVIRYFVALLIFPALGAVLTAYAGEDGMVTVAGEVYYRQRIALPPTAELYVAVEDVSRMDIPAVIMAESRIAPAGQVPIAFELRVDASRIDPRYTYAIRARIEDGGRLLWINTEHIPLRLDGSDEIRVRVDPVGG